MYCPVFCNDAIFSPYKLFLQLIVSYWFCPLKLLAVLPAGTFAKMGGSI